MKKLQNHHEDNFFDKLGFLDTEETKRLLDEQKVKGDKLDYLIHQTFAQNQSGAELLSLWSNTLMMMPTAQPNMDLIQIGINEGIKEFIRNITLTVKKVEAGDSNATRNN